MGESVDTSKQEILARLVAAETEARRKVDEAASLGRQTVAKAKETAEQMIQAARQKAASDAATLAAQRAQESEKEAAKRRAAADRRDTAFERSAQRNLDAAVNLIVDWITAAGSKHDGTP